MQAASMPNAIAFVAHRSRFHLPSKPLGIEVVCPHDRGRKKSCLFTYLFSHSIGILDDVDLSA